MKKFEDFLDHKYDAISQMAALLAEAQAGLDAKELSRSEFDEIAHDILEFADINEMTNDIDNKLAIKKAIEALIFIVDHIPLA